MDDIYGIIGRNRENALWALANRYYNMISALDEAGAERCESDPGTSYSHLLWMLNEIKPVIGKHTMPWGKANRWLGYIQGILIERGITTVVEEREWSRPHLQETDGD